MKRWKQPTIAVTGSMGKSTTKEMIDSILSTRWNVLKSPGNQNLPLHTKKTMESLTKQHQAIVLELGMGRPGAARRHCRYIKPDIAVFTNIGTAHIGNLGNDVRSTAESKGMLMTYMKKQGIVLINQDDANSRWLNTEQHQGRIVTIGIEKHANFQASKIQVLSDGISFVLHTSLGTQPFKLPIHGPHNVYNALFAIAVARLCGFSYSQIRTGLAKYVAPHKRLQMFQLPNHITLIDDTANSNTEAVLKALEVLHDKADGRKKVVVLGSMLELGDHSESAHRYIGTILAKNPVNTVYLYGAEMAKTRESAIADGFDPEHIHSFEDRELLHHRLDKEELSSSIILVKGSGGMKMGLTVDYLKEQLSCSISVNKEQQSGEVHIHSATCSRLKLSSPLGVHFGKYTQNMEVKSNDNIPVDTISVPQILSEEIILPDLDYDFRLTQTQLELGPVIGFSVLPRYMKDPMQQLARLGNRKFKGLIYLFRPSRAHRDTSTIDGLYFDPASQQFHEGTFPFPSAIFNRTPLTPAQYAIYKRRIGENIFNYPYGNTDKWKQWVRLSEKAQVARHLPDTTPYTGLKSVLNMLRKHDTVYFKPKGSAGGNGILALIKRSNGHVLKSVDNGEWMAPTKLRLQNLLQQHISNPSSYIIQQGIPAEFEAGKIDFRAYVQKNGLGTWTFSGLETKIGQKGSIISNSKKRLQVMEGKEALEQIFRMTPQQAEDKIQEISSLCIEVMKLMETRTRHLGDAAIDLIVDGQWKIWFLELQLNYAAEIKQFRTEDERRVLPHILFTPFEYAQYLAGFPVSSVSGYKHE